MEEPEALKEEEAQEVVVKVEEGEEVQPAQAAAPAAPRALGLRGG